MGSVSYLGFHNKKHRGGTRVSLAVTLPFYES